MSPRPILKQSRSPHQSYPAAPIYPQAQVTPSQHGVHFPPSPILTRTFSAYSSSLYDRSPIVVTPNSCALPERGCPGRTYTLDDASPTSSSRSFRLAAHNGRHLHPRAVGYRQSSPDINEGSDDEAQRTPTATFPVLPPLIPDLSSESDESDGFTSPQYDNAPPASYYPPLHSNPTGALSHPSIPFAHHRNISNDEGYFPSTPTALSFLPHPASPSDEAQKARRRKHRSRDRSRSQDGRQGSLDPRRGMDGSYKPLSVCKALANCSLEGPDDGCLGGF